jgi:hypothetical protein
VCERERGSSVDEVKMNGREGRKGDEISRKEKKEMNYQQFTNCIDNYIK